MALAIVGIGLLGGRPTTTPEPRPVVALAPESSATVVSVMVLGPTGGMIDAIRWPVAIGAIAETEPPRPSLGEDGLMGGLVFETTVD